MKPATPRPWANTDADSMKNLEVPEHYVTETAVKRGKSHMPWEANDNREIEDSLIPSTDDPKVSFDFLLKFQVCSSGRNPLQIR